MNKTKDEMIAEWVKEEADVYLYSRSKTFEKALRDIASRMYDARQKEINRLHIAINRICGAAMDNDMAEIRRLVDVELGEDDDAAARKILEDSK